MKLSQDMVLKVGDFNSLCKIAPTPSNQEKSESNLPHTPINTAKTRVPKLSKMHNFWKIQQ